MVISLSMPARCGVLNLCILAKPLQPIRPLKKIDKETPHLTIVGNDVDLFWGEGNYFGGAHFTLEKHLQRTPCVFWETKRSGSLDRKSVV